MADISPNSTSYPTLGALYTHYGDKKIPVDVMTASYWLVHTIVQNCRAGRREFDMNHISYELVRSFDILPRDLVDSLIRSATRAYGWCRDNK